tara:strand:+ start:2672 stop:3214 length:543 start_codon:yes stop_codon:yes gene_type:complete
MQITTDVDRNDDASHSSVLPPMTSHAPHPSISNLRFQYKQSSSSLLDNSQRLCEVKYREQVPEVLHNLPFKDPSELAEGRPLETDHRPSHPGYDEYSGVPLITSSTLLKVLQGTYNNLYKSRLIIDCRFDYEYRGGKIQGTLNFWQWEKLSEQLFSAVAPTSSTLIVLYCEFSVCRAPLM